MRFQDRATVCVYSLRQPVPPEIVARLFRSGLMGACSSLLPFELPQAFLSLDYTQFERCESAFIFEAGDTPGGGGFGCFEAFESKVVSLRRAMESCQELSFEILQPAVESLDNAILHTRLGFRQSFFQVFESDCAIVSIRVHRFLRPH
jgi:hypothetical protein